MILRGLSHCSTLEPMRSRRYFDSVLQPLERKWRTGESENDEVESEQRLTDEFFYGRAVFCLREDMIIDDHVVIVVLWLKDS